MLHSSLHGLGPKDLLTRVPEHGIDRQEHVLARGEALVMLYFPNQDLCGLLPRLLTPALGVEKATEKPAGAENSRKAAEWAG